MNIPSHKVANLFMLFLLAFNLLLALLIGQLYWGLLHDTAMGGFIRAPWFLIVIQVLGLLLPMFIFSLIFPNDDRLNTGSYPTKKEPLGLINFILIIVISLLLQPVMMLFAGLASFIFPNPITPVISEMAMLPLPVALIIVALTPSVCEELVFRGFIQSRYKNQPIVITAIVNGLFFGMIHLNLHQFTYAFAMGIVFVFMVHITKSVLSAILAHFVINSTQYTLSYLTIREFGPQADLPTNYELRSAISDLVNLAGFTVPLAAGLFYILVKHNAGKQPAEALEPEIKEKHPFDIIFFAVVLLFVVLMVAFY